MHPSVPVRRVDPLLGGLGVAAVATVLWSVLGPGFGRGGGVSGWALQAALDALQAVLCHRVIALDGLPPPTRRFWRALLRAELVFLLADTMETVLQLLGPPTGAVEQQTLQTLIVAAGVLLVVWVMLTHPLGAVGRERTRLWLDAATVLTGATVFAWDVTVGSHGLPTAPSAAVSAASSGIVMLVAAFALAKLALSKQAPFTFWAGVVGAVAAAMFGLEAALADTLRASVGEGADEALRLLACFVQTMPARIQELAVRAGTGARREHRRRSWHVLPYVMVAATMALLVTELARTGLHPRSWGVVAGVAVISTLVVVRQLLALSDNDRLVTDLDAGMRRLRALAEQVVEEKSLLTGVISGIPHLVYWKDEQRRYQGCNEAFLATRGLLAGSVIGRTEEEVQRAGGHDHGDELGTLLLELEAEVRAGGGAVGGRKVTVTGPEGAPQSLLLGVQPHPRTGGVEGGVIGVAADVSEVARLERQLAQANRLESIGQLAAGIAHEINTPVQYVTDNTRFISESLEPVLDGLRELRATAPQQGAGLTPQLQAVLEGMDVEFLSAEVPDALQQSLEGLARVAAIVRAMKDFAHPGQERTRCDLNRAVESTVEVSRAEWTHVARLTLDLDPQLGHIPCHEGEIKQALLNVIVNAAQAVVERRARGARPGPAAVAALGEIRVSTRREGDLVRIAVSDDGPGMDEATARRVFDPFFTTKPIGTGTGQGLSITHTIIVTNHGGDIAVASTPGRGTTFTLTLPAGAPGGNLPAG